MKPHAPRVLVADDDPELLGSLVDILEHAGYRVSSAKDGAQLLDTVASERKRPDIIISDVDMPGCTGLNVLEELRAEGWTQPLIVISGLPPNLIDERVRRLANVHFVAKPFRAETLLAVVDGLHPAH